MLYYQHNHVLEANVSSGEVKNGVNAISNISGPVETVFPW